MGNREVAALLVAAVIASTMLGYFVGISQPSSGRCEPWGSLIGAIPAGVNVTVSYRGDWYLAVAEFASNQTKASALNSVCSYQGSGNMSFYVPIANYQGWNTVVAKAQRIGGAEGTLEVTIMFGGSSTNSTSTTDVIVTASYSFFER